MKKQVSQLFTAGREQVGEHPMYQPLPSPEAPELDPFLLLHHHGPHLFAPYNQGLPFAPHPHRGFETLTIILAGAVEHADSLGYQSTIDEGGVQWMTAGRGLVHSENLPAVMREKGGEMEILQLWMNLPARLKKVPPRYQGFQKKDLPVVNSGNGISTQVISGEHRSVKGPAESSTHLTIYSVAFESGATEEYTLPAGEQVFLYVTRGEVVVNGKLAYDHQQVLFKPEGTKVEIKTQSVGHFILASGSPLNEPVVQHGPFVMNSTTEILEAMRDYQMGKMGIM